jgi:hypothetical protein
LYIRLGKGGSDWQTSLECKLIAWSIFVLSLIKIALWSSPMPTVPFPHVNDKDEFIDRIYQAIGKKPGIVSDK